MSTYSTDLRIQLIADGDQAGTWGQTTNTNLGTIIEQAIAGVSGGPATTGTYPAVNFPTDADITLTANNGTPDQARNAVLVVTSSVSLSAQRNVIAPAGASKVYIISNQTSGGQNIQIKYPTGGGVIIGNALNAIVYGNGTNFNLVSSGGSGGGANSGTQVNEFTATQGQTVFTTTFNYTPNLNQLAVFVNGSKQIVTTNYTETSNTTITFVTGLNVGDLVEIIYNQALSGGVISSQNITYTQGSTGSVTTNVQAKLQQTVSVKDFGAIGDGVTNDTSAIAAAISATPTNGTLYFPSGTYVASMSIRKSNISIVGAGSASTKMIMPAGVNSIVCELGNTALGNSAPAFTNINVSGFTFDGNYLNVPTPSTDVTGQGFATTNVSYSRWTDIICQNTQNSAFGTFINSNYNYAEVTCINGGNAVIYSGHYPNFDINSSKYSIYRVVSQNGYYGGRMLDNCYGNHLKLTANNPSITGFVYNNQTVNSSYGNTIEVNINSGCASGQGVSIGSNCYNSTVIANINNVAGTGFYDGNSSSSTYTSYGNKYLITTYQCGGASVLTYGYNNQFTINSKYDGYGSSAGTYFAVDVYGSYNQFTINVQDQATPLLRGLVFRSGSQYNNVIDFVHNTLVQNYNNIDTSNTNNYWFQYAGNNVQNTFSFASGWSNTYGSPYAPCQYQKDYMGVVHLQGVATGGTGTITTLPVGYRPTSTLNFPTVSNGAVAIVNITSAGVISLGSGSAASVILNGITFTTY